VSDSLESILTEKAGNKLALSAVNHVEEIARDDLAVLFDETLDGVINLTSKVLDGEDSRCVLSHEVASRKLSLGRADLDSSVLAIETSSKSLKELHICSVSSSLVIENAKKTVAGLQDASNSVRVIEIAGRSNADFLRLQHISLAVEEVLESKVVNALGSSIVEKLVERRASGSLLAETGEIDDRDSVGNGLLGSTKSLVNGLKNPSHKKRVKCSGKLSGVSTSTVRVEHNSNTFSVDHLGLVAQSGLEVSGADTKESSDDAENILVLDSSNGCTTLVRETTTIIASDAGLASCLKL